MSDNSQINMISPRWKLFLRVAQLGSLTRAAVVLDMQQSAISVQINALERECGGRLFSRTGRGVVLTSLGEHVLPRLKALALEAEQLGEDILATSRVPSGEVKVGVVASIAQPLVNRLFRRMRDLYPKVQLQILEGFSGNIDEWLSTGQIDIGLLNRYSRRLDAREQKLFEGSSYLISRGRQGKAPETVAFTELHNLMFVLPYQPSGLRVLLNQIANKKRITITVQMEANSLATIKDVIKQGDVFTVLPYQAVYREVNAGELRASRIVSPSIDRTVALATTSQKPLSLAARETAKALRELMCEIALEEAWAITQS